MPIEIQMLDAKLTNKLVTTMDKYNLDRTNASHAKPVKLDINWIEYKTDVLDQDQPVLASNNTMQFQTYAKTALLVN
jgi:hypothetical protein